ncbi:MAG: YdeI/OmpD-associated family protein [Micrococcaceae bacterium]
MGLKQDIEIYNTLRKYGLLEKFKQLPRERQIQLIKWVSEAKHAVEKDGRIKELIGMLKK